MFSHPLKCLYIPKFIYRIMTYGSGFPNRFLFYRYKELLLTLNPSTRFYVTGLHGVDTFEEIYLLADIPSDLKNKSRTFIRTHLSRFASEFSSVSVDDLAISSFFFVCKKHERCGS